ncbi:SOS response-associated peptidase [Geomonas subterranea]|uniref:SOS response-associated peptidase n=1 Tax=Geomonas subterranea TaxID=2847989 RepID=UPI001CD5143B|nr:SOS response-associated peptidase family protein [Geomonas fuzhouensis]
MWETWTAPEGETIETCSILTTDANELMRSVHDRMPVILAPGDFALWLDAEVRDPAKLQHLYRPFETSHLQEWEVATLVNSTRNTSEECIKPALTQAPLF